jgi:dihydrofolate reductase
MRKLCYYVAVDLAAQLFAADLVDEVVVKLNPLLLGEGIPFVSTLRAPRSLRLRETRGFDSGVVFLRYDVERGAATS